MNTSVSPSERVIDGLACRIYGTGQPLLMIHGIISDSTFFDACAQWLSHFYTVITYDRRSYGNSNTEKYTDYTVKTQADDAAAILEAVGLGPAYILGNSAGGLIGLELTMQHPHLVKGLLMIEPSLGYDPAEREKLLAWNKLLNEYADAGQYKQVLPEFTKITGGSTGGGSFSMAEMKRTYRNLTAFLKGELNDVQHYLPSKERLSQIDVPVAVAVTERGKESIFATSSESACEIIGWPLFHLPGYHNTYKEFPSDAAIATHGIFSSMEKNMILTSKEVML